MSHWKCASRVMIVPIGHFVLGKRLDMVPSWISTKGYTRPKETSSSHQKASIRGQGAYQRADRHGENLDRVGVNDKMTIRFAVQASIRPNNEWGAFVERRHGGDKFSQSQVRATCELFQQCEQCHPFLGCICLC